MKDFDPMCRAYCSNHLDRDSISSILHLMVGHSDSVLAVLYRVFNRTPLCVIVFRNRMSFSCFLMLPFVDLYFDICFFFFYTLNDMFFVGYVQAMYDSFFL